ncbi:hypothetical protein [Planctomyces sp. SH-PL62]|uniref:hypothetical protein n=1 Tax=Planctomyces sp. SH-PL62 TaxID=1636152 RepID=UPI00078EB5D0|nr:hypothetical protein [Planctomyces sp. SH-PL62]AMV40027.1 hypothetical protein VT85_21515 [Planctomyces sp. SH-PL62]
MKRAAMFSRRVVDPVNSVAWFAMDALWLAQLAGPAYLASAATLSTGATLLFLNWRRWARLRDDLTLNAWMWMNALWMISDLGDRPMFRKAALGFAILGAILLANELRPSPNRFESLARFKKMRIPPRPRRR